MPIRIVIGCRSHLLSEGLQKLLQDDGELKTIGIFTEGVDFKEILKVKADIMLIDYGIFMSLAEDFAIDEQSKILLLDTGITTFPIREIPDMVSRGVVGILPPSIDSVLLKKALKAVSSGDLWINHKTIKDIFSSRKFPEKKAPLTRMENEIMSCICQGYRNKEIGQKFNISEKTVRSNCNRIYNKFGVSDRIQLVIYCLLVADAGAVAAAQLAEAGAKALGGRVQGHGDGDQAERDRSRTEGGGFYPHVVLATIPRSP